MASGTPGILQRDFNTLFESGSLTGLTDRDLIERVTGPPDAAAEAAFEALVTRHGPMVLRVCRNVLGGLDDAEDAFQATFLVLVRRARALGPRDAIGPWLHGVAARVSMRARSQAARRRRVEPIDPEHAGIAHDASHSDGELAAILDQEVNRLPAKYRSPIVLCYLQGQTHEEAARQLNWPIGTVKGRLSRARELLRSRLVRRGVAPAAAILGASVAREASAAMDREFLDKTVQICMKVTFGQAPIDSISISIASLVKGALSAMILDKLKWVGVAALATGLAFSGAVVVARQQGGGLGGDRPKKTANRPPAHSVASDSVKTPPSGSDVAPLGENANVADVAKSHLLDLRNQLVQAARNEWTATRADYLRNQATLERVHDASKRLMSAEEEAHGKDGDRAAAATGHFDRMREVARIQDTNPAHTEGQAAQVKAYAAEAELWQALASSGTGGSSKPTGSSAASPDSGSNRDYGREGFQIGAKGTSGRGQDPRSRQILAKLEDLIVMRFQEETPLEEIIKHIKDATKSSDMPDGLPIYINPIGLAEADKTMTSTIRNIDLQGVPLRRTLQLALTQLELAYFVDDGMLYITSQESADTLLPPATASPTPLQEKVERADRGELSLTEMKELIEILKLRREIEKLRNAPEGGGKLQ
jgi:RNA polymerase sigma factor (sigma-70 family)